MFPIRSWPTAIAHIDGDAFFASVIQATYPHLRGKPVVTGQERGIATAVSYEARKLGVKRGMRIFEIKRICPSCTIHSSDYELYDLFSKRMFAIIREYCREVEEYSIDEGFTSLTGLRGILHMSYEQIGAKIQREIRLRLGIGVSVGISLTKSLAKVASNYQKPMGITVIDGTSIPTYLDKISVKNIWGIGSQTTAYLHKYGIKTALEFVNQNEWFIRNHLSKPYFEIWKELQGTPVYKLNTELKTTYQSMSETRTFTPATTNVDFLWSQLIGHIEAVFSKARSYHYQIGKIAVFLKTQTFAYHAAEMKVSQKIQYPFSLHEQLHTLFMQIYQAKTLYRATGCVISDLTPIIAIQNSLFDDVQKERKIERVYPFYEQRKVDFGSSLFSSRIKRGRKKEKHLSIPFLTLQNIG